MASCKQAQENNWQINRYHMNHFAALLLIAIF